MVASQSIVNRAMLVSLHMGGITATASDKKATRDAAVANNADQSMLDTRKRLWRKEALAAFNAHQGKVRQEYYRLTLPWDDDGARALTSEAYDTFVSRMRALGAEYDEIAQRFMDTFDSERDLARALLGDIGTWTKYPSMDKLRRRLKMTWEVKPIPTSQDFRCEMSTVETQAAIQAALDSALDDKVRDGMAHVYSRIQEALNEFVGKLKAYNPDKPKEHPFRNTVLAPLKKLVLDLPMLKLADDDIIDDYTDRLTSLIEFEPDQLREQHSVRERVMDQAEKILEQMAPFIA